MESIDFFGHMDMIAIRDIAFICDTGNNTETLLETFREFVCSGLDRSSIQGEVNIRLSFPFCSMVIQASHDFQSELSTALLSVALSGDRLSTFVQASVSQGDRRVSIIQESIDSLTFLKSGESAILPEDRSDIRRSAFQPIMTDHQSRETKTIQALAQEIKEPLFFFCLILNVFGSDSQSHIRQRDRDHSLIKATIILVLRRIEILSLCEIALSGIRETIRSEERSASHTGVYVAFQLSHDFRRNVIRNHALCGAFCR